MKTGIMAALLAAAAIGGIQSVVSARKVIVKPQPGEQVTVIVSQPTQKPQTAKYNIAQAPQVDLVFVLDTTGSMSGLIKGAKEKIWSIVNTVSQARPTPKIRLGIIGFRDRGDAYVTDFNPLTSDLDSIYVKLMAYRAQGGGDRPESVNQALNEAVTRMNWSNAPNSCRTIFLVGDSPPHMNYQRDVKYRESCRLAQQKDVTVNTVLCGHHDDTRRIWQDIAQRGNGAFFQVEQGGGAVIVATPYDREIKRLSAEFESCRITYGDAKVHRRAAYKRKLAGKVAMEASDSVNAQRACYNVSASAAMAPASRRDLLSQLERKEMSMADVKQSNLPVALQKMDSDELKAYVAKQQARRKEISGRIRKLSEQRQSYIKKNVNGDKLEKSFENNVFKNMSKQLKKKGIQLKESDLKL